MKITKYAQFTFIVENAKGKRLLIDPGKFNYMDNFTPADFGPVDLLLITHKHGDHHDLAAEGQIINLHAPMVYTNPEIGAKEIAKKRNYQIADVGDVIESCGFKISLVATDHFVKGEMLINFGMFIESDGQSFYHTSDTRFMEQSFYDFDLIKKPDVLAVPISNRGIVMGIDDAIVFTSEVQPKIVIPAHYDNPIDRPRVHPSDFAQQFSILEERLVSLQGVKVVVLDFGESIEL